ncbi:hypothetical protein Purlil1_13712 [Purpureocillium lilacinum]|uniref:GH18 domain-containing protein n=1 Tax=Purpureocillium lilacinum TaxID=33203 RepID=A0ABR0BDF5_PURLI|nr:hypothetical protein Purlil1_13712 [Purpureocillium lilacinum]
MPRQATHNQKLHHADTGNLLDYVNLMAYDFAGSWVDCSGHDANLNQNPEDASTTPEQTSAWHAHLRLQRTTGIGQPYAGVGSGSRVNGVWDYKVLPKAGAKLMYDDIAKGYYTYDSATQELNSYDPPDIIKAKANLPQRPRPRRQHVLGRIIRQEGRGVANQNQQIFAWPN